MSVAIDGGRPALLGGEALAEMRELLKFRHLARHGYEADPDLARMTEHAGRVARGRSGLVLGLRAVGAWLRA